MDGVTGVSAADMDRGVPTEAGSSRQQENSTGLRGEGEGAAEGQAGQESSGEAGQDSSGEAGQTSTSGEAGQKSSGEAGQESSGEAGQNSSGEAGQASSGEAVRQASGSADVASTSSSPPNVSQLEVVTPDAESSGSDSDSNPMPNATNGQHTSTTTSATEMNPPPTASDQQAPSTANGQQPTEAPSAVEEEVVQLAGLLKCEVKVKVSLVIPYPISVVPGPLLSLGEWAVFFSVQAVRLLFLEFVRIQCRLLTSFHS